MIDPKNFVTYLKTQGLDYFTGVPDSILKNFINELPETHLKANEGSAIAAAIGYHLATKNIATVYMQNSGLGNAINPLATMALVYKIPVLLFIGWRGEDKDEPQHEVMGKASAKMLEAIGIEHDVLSIDESKSQSQIVNAYNRMLSQQSPYAFLVRKNTFKTTKQIANIQGAYQRSSVIKELISNLKPGDKIFATAGYTGRELYALAKKMQKLEHIFLGTGAMGHINQLALEFALNSKRNTYCLDGDGSAIMHLGNLQEMSQKAPKNLKYIVFNNSSHQSVGLNESLWKPGEISKALKGFGAHPVDALDKLIQSNKFSVWEVICGLEVMDSLPRPAENPIELKELFLNDKAK